MDVGGADELGPVGTSARHENGGRTFSGTTSVGVGAEEEWDRATAFGVSSVQGNSRAMRPQPRFRKFIFILELDAAWDAALPLHVRKQTQNRRGWTRDARETPPRIEGRRA